MKLLVVSEPIVKINLKPSKKKINLKKSHESQGDGELSKVSKVTWLRCGLQWTWARGTPARGYSKLDRILVRTLT